MPNPDEKYDIIPEIWQGHNIADFVDPDIMKVSQAYDTPESFLRQSLAQVILARKLAQVTFASST